MDFNFCGPTYTARSIYADDEECINLYPEILQVKRPDGRGQVNLYPVPGKKTLLTFADLAEVRGLWVFSGSTIMIAVCGPSVYSVSTGFVATLIGTLATSSGPVSISDNGTVAMLVDGVNRYVYNPTTGYFSSLSATSFTASINATTMTVTAVSSGLIGLNQVIVGAGVTPGTTVVAFVSGTGLTGTYTVSPSQGPLGPVTMTAGDGAFNGGSQVREIDTFFIYPNPNTIQWGASNSNSASSNPLSFAPDDGSADLLVTLTSVNREVFLLHERSSSVWVDQGSFPFPFVRLPGTSTQHGCAAAYSVARIGESFAWLGKDDRGQGVVWKMAGYVPERISTYAVENATSTYPIISDARAYSYQQGGHEFYVLTFPSADVTWVYDSTTNLWHKRAYRDALNVLHRDRGNCAAIFSNKVVVGDWQNGNLYSLDLNIYTDAGGVPLWRMRRAPHLTSDLKRVSYQELQIQYEPGVGLVSGQGSDPQAMLTYSDDGGSTWSNQHWTSVGKIGQYKNRARWQRLGMARDRIFQVEMSDPVKFVIVSANLRAQAEAH
jgi:hypothetical protein